MLRKTHRPATILFLHLPKTAGISLRSVFFQGYEDAQIFRIEPNDPVSSIRQLKSLSKRERRHLKLVTGHTLWGAHYFVEAPFLYVTMLRDPVERVLSSFSYIRSLPSHFLYEEMHASEMSLKKFLTWKKSQFEVENQQTKLLAGVFNTKKACTQDVYKQAVEHLEKYCLVGLTEHFAQSLTMFENILELEHAEVPKSNVTHQRLRRTEIEPDVLEEIHRRNQYDLALYSKAEKLFTETLENPTSILSTKKMSSSSRDKNAENCDFILI